MSESNILLFLHLLTFQGERILGRRWRDFILAIKDRLRRHGVEDEDSNPEFIRFRFMRPHSALGAATEAIAAAKKATAWPEDKKVPAHIILDIPVTGQPGPEIIVSAPGADLLLPEQPYITRKLKREWPRLTVGSELAGAEFEPAGNELFLLKLPDSASITPRPLFRGRPALLKGTGPGCFYCAARNHETGQCPSRLLGMEHRGAPLLGYMSIEEIDAACTALLEKPGVLADIITPTLDPGRIRKDTRLKAACGLFDVGIVFQPRFLRNLVFSIDPKWEKSFSSRNQNIDDPRLNLAFDSLRSGNYLQAKEMFEAVAASSRKAGHYGATVGLALLALETGEPRHALALLTRAREIALTEKETVHAHLMLVRHHLLTNDLWKAADELGKLKRSDRNHWEIRYAAVQVEARRGERGAIDELAKLVHGDREVFVRALLDPLLAPVNGLVEEILAARLAEVRARAVDVQKAGIRELDELALWTGEDSPDWKENRRLAETVAGLIESGGYFSLIDAEARGSALLLACQRIREDRMHKLKESLRKTDSCCRRCTAFWNGFPYARLFSEFGKRLAAAGMKNQKAGERISGVMSGREYKRTAEQMQELLGETGRLLRELERIRTIGSLLDAARAFGRYLLITETVLLLSVFAGVALLTGGNGALAVILGDPVMQRRIIYLAGFLAAPAISLILTAIKRR